MLYGASAWVPSISSFMIHDWTVDGRLCKLLYLGLESEAFRSLISRLKAS
jgi:hypothetical protein